MLFYEERLVAPHIDILLEELLELRIIGNRVDHPRKKSKDLADAMCGSVYNSISNTERDRVKEINIHTWSQGGVDEDNMDDFLPDKVKGRSSNWNGGGYRLV
jgi:hypothetical protein